MSKLELLKQIKPQINKESDKYSWQLYQFVKMKSCTKAFYDLKEDEPYDHMKPRWNRVYICKVSDGDILGNSMMSIMSPYRKYDMNCYTEENGYNFIDITDAFWDMYIKDGRCVFDRSHSGWWAGGSRFIPIDENTQTCDWCGKKLHKEEYIVEVKKTRWI